MVLLLRRLPLPTLALEGSVEEDAHASCRRGHGSPRAHLCPRPRLGRRATDVGSAAMQQASIVEQGLTCGVTRVLNIVATRLRAHAHAHARLDTSGGGRRLACVEQRACRGALPCAYEVAASPRRAAECALLHSGVRSAQEARRPHLAPS